MIAIRQINIVNSYGKYHTRMSWYHYWKKIKIEFYQRDLQILVVKAYEIINDRLTDNELSVCFREDILRTFRYLVKLKKP